MDAKDLTAVQERASVFTLTCQSLWGGAEQTHSCGGVRCARHPPTSYHTHRKQDCQKSYWFNIIQSAFLALFTNTLIIKQPSDTQPLLAICLLSLLQRFHTPPPLSPLISNISTWELRIGVALWRSHFVAWTTDACERQFCRNRRLWSGLAEPFQTGI